MLCWASYKLEVRPKGLFRFRENVSDKHISWLMLYTVHRVPADGMGCLVVQAPEVFGFSQRDKVETGRSVFEQFCCSVRSASTFYMMNLVSIDDP